MVFSDTYAWGAKLGAGAFGEVRRARGRETGAKLAVKTMHAGEPQQRRSWPLSFLDGPPRVRLGLIQREAETWRHVGQHPNVVRLVDLCFSNSGIHFVMERCGANLQEAMQDVRGRGLAEVRRISRELLLALEHVHSRSVLHRDVKPANLLLGTDPRRTMKLCDFGAAVRVAESGEHHGAGGTPNYLPPETMRTHVFAAKSDTWAAGVTVYKLLYGSHPYFCPEGTTPDNVETGRVRPDYSPAHECANGAWLQGHAALQSVELVAALLQRNVQLRADAVMALGLDFAAVEELDSAMFVALKDEPGKESQATAPGSAASATAQRPRGLRCCLRSERANAFVSAPEAASGRPSKDTKAVSERDEDEITEAPTSDFFGSIEGSRSVICQ